MSSLSNNNNDINDNNIGTEQPRKRCYGGKGGTFVRRTPRRSKPGQSLLQPQQTATTISPLSSVATDALSTSTVSASVSATGSKTDMTGEGDDTDNGQTRKQGSTAAAVGILWDDVRCRPIFLDDVAKISSDDDGSQVGENPNDDDNDSKKQMDSDNGTVRSHKTHSDANGKKGRTDTMHPSPVVGTKRCRRGRQASRAVAALRQDPNGTLLSTPRGSETYDCSSPTFAGRSICWTGSTETTDNTPQSEPETRKRSNGQRRCRRKLLSPETGQTNTETATVSSKKAAKNKTATKDSLDFVPDKETPLVAPGCATSRSSARAYFAKLDSTQKLVVVKDQDQPDHSRCVRTSRRAPIVSAMLLHEYKGYARATTEAGVKPLPLMEYARNRPDFYRPGGVLDGFLDG